MDELSVTDKMEQYGKIVIGYGTLQKWNRGFSDESVLDLANKGRYLG